MRQLLSLICFCAALQAAPAQFFIQLSDPQMGMFAANANTLQDEANFRFAIANINRLHPAFFVITGDLVNKVGDAQQIRVFKDALKSLDPAIPVYNVPGNHDVGNEPTPAQILLYQREFGKDYYAFDSHDIRGIVLDSSLIGSPAQAVGLAAAQDLWLEKELERAQADHVAHVIVFQHIPYFLESASEPDQYFNIARAARRKHLELFHKYGVLQVFAGHYHRNAHGKDGDLDMTTTGPVGMHLGPDQSGLRVVRVSGQGIESRYYELGTIPNTIDPNLPLPQTTR
jgi:3',5'-cyclic AMP phosphodiesterase CpdA